MDIYSKFPLPSNLAADLTDLVGRYGRVRLERFEDNLRLICNDRPLLEELSARTEESVTLAVAKRFNLVYVDQVDPPNLMAPNWLDKPLPLHATSGGKAFLAWLSPDERHAILPEELPRYTPRTITRRSLPTSECTPSGTAISLLCVGYMEL